MISIQFSFLNFKDKKIYNSQIYILFFYRYCSLLYHKFWRSTSLTHQSLKNIKFGKLNWGIPSQTNARNNPISRNGNNCLWGNPHLYHHYSSPYLESKPMNQTAFPYIFSHESQNQIFPYDVTLFFFETEGKAASFMVFWILPKRFDSAFEQIEVSIFLELTGSLYMLVIVPKLFDCGSLAHRHQTLAEIFASWPELTPKFQRVLKFELFLVHWVAKFYIYFFKKLKDKYL